MGSLVWAGTINNGEDINLRDLKKGIYFARVGKMTHKLILGDN